MSRIKSLVMTYRDHDLSTLAKAYFTNEELAKLYKSYDSLVALETCNRIELYLDGDEDEGGLIELIYEKAGIKLGYFMTWMQLSTYYLLRRAWTQCSWGRGRSCPRSRGPMP